MKVASGLAFGQRPVEALAEQAVSEALARAGCQRADQVILLLSKDLSRHPQPGLRAAARTAACLQVAGCTASGLLTERGWQIDQPAAAALILADLPTPAGALDKAPGTPQLSFSGQGRLAWDWLNDQPRAGLIDSETNAWQQARESADLRSSPPLPGLRARVLLAPGWRALGEPQPVDLVAAHELRRLGGQRASDNLRRALPGELRAQPPIHQLCLVRDENLPGIAILSINSDGSVTLAERLQPGDQVRWALRQPLAAEQEIRQQMATAANAGAQPLFALMFSCIGRGPLFYGDDDRDLLAFREYFPDTPLLGAYGTGQIFPGADGQGNLLFQNAVLTLLYERNHVQSHA